MDVVAARRGTAGHGAARPGEAWAPMAHEGKHE